MKKRFIATIMVFCLVFSLFTVTSNAASKKKVKYVKVKSTTYQTYRKAYSQNKTLKNQIKSKNNAIKTKNKTISNLNTQLKNKNQQITKLQGDLKSANSMNSWVWNNIKSIGLSYNNKNWTIPAEIPEKFIIDGVTYTVTREEPNNG